MDDVIILSDDKEELHRVKRDIEEFLRDFLRLDLNKKTAIRPCSMGVEFCGFKLWPTHRKLKKQTSKRIIRHVKKMCQQLHDGEISRKYFDRATASYKGVLQHCNSYGPRQKLNAIYKQYYIEGKEEITNG